MNAAGTPLRRGTYRELGIGLRWSRPRGILVVPRRLSDEKVAELEQAFQDKRGASPVWIREVPRSLSARPPLHHVIVALWARRRRARRLRRGRMRR